MWLMLPRAVSRPLSTSSVLRYEDEPAAPSGLNERWVTRNPPSLSLYVGNIPFTAQENDLRELFHTFGEIKAIRVAYRMDGTASGFAHIEFAKQSEATAAMNSAAEEPIFLMGRTLRIDYAGKGVEAQPSNRLYFHGFNGGEAEIRNAAREFESSIINFYLLKDPTSGQPTGTGFIEFMSIDRATEALERLNGTVLGDGQKLNLKYAKGRQPRRDSNPRGQRPGYAGDWGGGRRSEEFQQDRRGTGRPPRY